MAPHFAALPSDAEAHGTRPGDADAAASAVHTIVRPSPRQLRGASADYSALVETAQKEMDNALFNCFAFVPIEVVARLHKGLEGEEGAAQPTKLGAFVSDIECAVLFSDVSGFTQLTERLQREKGGEEGAETLNAILNSFFEQLITIVHDHDGDVIKFAGDAVLSMWSSSSGEGLEDLVARASACALEQLQKLDFYQGGFDTTLRLHLGLGAGKGTGLDLGMGHRREFVVAGPPLDEMSTAEGIAGHGEVVVGPTAWAALVDCDAEPQGEACGEAKGGAGYFKLRKLERYVTPQRACLRRARPPLVAAAPAAAAACAAGSAAAPALPAAESRRRAELIPSCRAPAPAAPPAQATGTAWRRASGCSACRATSSRSARRTCSSRCSGTRQSLCGGTSPPPRCNTRPSSARRRCSSCGSRGCGSAAPMSSTSCRRPSFRSWRSSPSARCRWLGSAPRRQKAAVGRPCPPPPQERPHPRPLLAGPAAVAAPAASRLLALRDGRAAFPSSSGASAAG